jgi:hypothetical protein
MVLKWSLRLLLALSAYVILAGLYTLLRPPMIYQTLSLILVISLFIFGYQLTMSYMPSPIRNGFRRVTGWGARLMWNVMGWGIKKIWELVR